MNKRKMRTLPKFIITLSVLAIVFLFSLGVYDVFFNRGDNETVPDKTGDYPLLFDEEITKASLAFDVDKHIIASVIYCESSFDKDAVSSAGAVGLMQLLPETLEWLCMRHGTEYSEKLLRDPEKNIYYGTMYLSILYGMYGNWDAVHAAYHAGFGRVNKWLEEETVFVNQDGKMENIPIEQTASYVQKLRLVKPYYIEKIYERGDIEWIIKHLRKSFYIGEKMALTTA